MEVHIPNERVVNEALRVISDYDVDKVHSITLKLLSMYKKHVDAGKCSWKLIYKYVGRQYNKEKEMNSNG